MNETTGWRSRFDVGVRGGVRRIVMHGNVLDNVLVQNSEGKINALTLVAWLCEELQRHGFQRVIEYDHLGLAVTLLGSEPEEFARLDDRQRQSYATGEVAPVLERLKRILSAEDGPRTALVIRNAVAVLQIPSKSFGYLLNLNQDGRRTSSNKNLEIQIYTGEGGIPLDFLRADPECEAILVATPRFDERLAYFNSLHPGKDSIRQVVEQGVQVPPDHLARVTEGFRLTEVLRLSQLSQSTEAGIELSELLNEFRFGRRHENFKDISIPAVKKRLHEVLRGQDRAIDQIEDGLYIAKHKVAEIVFEKSSRLPAMVLFFVGATGVGKTLMARTICEAVTGTVENLKIFDMTEYQQDHTVQRFIGPPPGYVGYSEGGQLTNWVRERPYSVVLIDEVEKAHERILDIFMQILEGARLTDGRGVTVDFGETILIFTSNIGATDARGLDPTDRSAVEKYFREQVEQYFNDDLERPELFNRMKQGGIVVFDFIDEKSARKVINEKFIQIAAEINDKNKNRTGVNVVVNSGTPQQKEVVNQLLGFSRYKEYGLRSVNNEIMQRAGAGIGRFLDDTAPMPGNYHFEWNEQHQKVAIVHEH